MPHGSINCQFYRIQEQKRAQKTPPWFNKLLILLNSGLRPPLCCFLVFAREEQRFIERPPEQYSTPRTPHCRPSCRAHFDGGGKPCSAIDLPN